MSKADIKNVQKEFLSDDSRQYKFRIGKHKASSLSGLIAGAILASIIWFAVAYFMNILK